MKVKKQTKAKENEKKKKIMQTNHVGQINFKYIYLCDLSDEEEEKDEMNIKYIDIFPI